jgi:hypothetical protein
MKVYLYKLDKFISNLTKIFINDYEFIYYSNSSFNQKQAIEVLNLYFKDVPYYVLFTDLKYEENKQKFMNTLNIFKKAIKDGILSDKFFFVVMDNSKVYRYKNRILKM